MGASLGLNLESKKDSGEDSENEKTNWGLVFMLLKSRGFTHEEILNLSYPQFNAYMKNINNPLSYSVVIPYMGSSDENNDNGNENKIESKEELLSVIASMNSDFT